VRKRSGGSYSKRFIRAIELDSAACVEALAASAVVSVLVEADPL
jgi:hypothetical protein